MVKTLLYTMTPKTQRVNMNTKRRRRRRKEKRRKGKRRELRGKKMVKGTHLNQKIVTPVSDHTSALPIYYPLSSCSTILRYSYYSTCTFCIFS